MIRVTLAAAVIGAAGFAGLALAAPASADPFDINGMCPDGSHTPCYTNNGPVWADTVHNWLVFGPKTANSYAHLPGDTVAGYQNAIQQTIKNYTGIG